MTFASKTTYPFLLCLGEKDAIVNNKVTRKWYDRVGSTVKEIKIIPKAYHELSKEPNNDVFFEAVLKFMAKQQEQARPLGEFNPRTDVRFAKKIPYWRRKKLWKLLVVIYLFIGLLFVLIKRRKNLFLSWPALMVIAKRLK